MGGLTGASWRTRIGLVSSSVHQMMDDNETALKAVVSGRYAQIRLLGRGCATRIGALPMRSLRRIEARGACGSVRGDFSRRGERQRVLIGAER